MELTVNGESREFGSEMSIQKLLKKCAVKMPEMVSVELNGKIIRRDLFASEKVGHGDQIEFLYFMGGG